MAETLAERMRRLQGGGGSRSESLSARMRRLDEEERRARGEDPDRPAISNFGRGTATGLAESGYGLAQGAAWVGNALTPGQPFRGVDNWAQRGKEEARDFWDAEGGWGTAGRVTGRILGEGATTVAGGMGVAKGVLAAARGTGRVARAATPLARAIAAAREGNFAQRVAANAVPALPFDVALGAGAAEPGENRLKSAAVNVAYGVGGASLFEGVATAMRVGRRAFHKATDYGKGMLDDLGHEGLDDLGRVPERPIQDPRYLIGTRPSTGDLAGPAIPMRAGVPSPQRDPRRLLGAAPPDRVHGPGIPLRAPVPRDVNASIERSENLRRLPRGPLITAPPAPREPLGGLPADPVPPRLQAPDAPTKPSKRYAITLKYQETGPGGSAGPIVTKTYRTDKLNEGKLDEWRRLSGKGWAPVIGARDLERRIHSVDLVDNFAPPPALAQASQLPPTPTEARNIKSARTASGGLRDLTKLHDDALAREYAERTESMLGAQERSNYTFIEDEGGHMGDVGRMVPMATRRGAGPSRQAKAFRNLAQIDQTMKRIEAEWARRGKDPLELYRGTDLLEVERRAKRTGAPEDVERAAMSSLEEPRYEAGDGEGFNLFSNPVGPVARNLADPAVGAGLGAGVGAAADEENRWRGAALGAGVGAGASFLAKHVGTSRTSGQVSRRSGVFVSGADVRAGKVGTDERVVTASVRLPDGSYATGPTHSIAWQNAVEAGKVPAGLMYEEADALFLTSAGRHVDRGEAFEIAEQRGQVKRPALESTDMMLGDVKPGERFFGSTHGPKGRTGMARLPGQESLFGEGELPKPVGRGGQGFMFDDFDAGRVESRPPTPAQSPDELAKLARRNDKYREGDLIPPAESDDLKAAITEHLEGQGALFGQDPSAALKRAGLEWSPYVGESGGWFRRQGGIEIAAVKNGNAYDFHAIRVEDGEVLASGRFTPDEVARQVQQLKGPGRGRAGAIVYHGSPHKFDKFDNSKIGTGEGAQAYGHGLYFAEHPDVARTYVPEGSTLEMYKRIDNDANRVAQGAYADLRESDGFSPADRTPQRVIERLQRLAAEPLADPDDVAAMHRAIAALEAGHLRVPRNGQLYTADLPDEAIDDMLDWDKPFSQQSPKVQRALVRLYEERGLAASSLSQRDPEASAMYFTVGMGKQDVASRLLREQGIPGIRYLDGQSRGAGQGSRNYVVFDDQLPKILPDEKPPRLRGATMYRRATGGESPPSDASGPKSRPSLSTSETQRGPSNTDDSGLPKQGGRGRAGVVRIGKGEQPTQFAAGDAEISHPRLSALHNLGPENLEAADALGGMPAPSIAVVPEGQPFTQYGSVTMIGRKSLGDPSQVPVFDADAYTGRSPQPEYKPRKWKEIDQLVKPMKSTFDSVGDDHGALNVTNELEAGRPDRAADALRRSLGGQTAFLEERGIKVKRPQRARPLHDSISGEPALVRFFKEAGKNYDARPGDEYWNRLSAAAREAVDSYVARVYAGRGDANLADDVRRSLLERYVDAEDGQLHFGRGHWMMDDQQRIGQRIPDDAKIRTALEKQIKPLQQEFEAWVDAKVAPFRRDPRVSIGRRKAPYNLENATAAAVHNRNIAAAEKTMTFGPGNARAAASTRFSSITHARNAARGQIVPPEELDRLKGALKEEEEAWRDAMLQSGGGHRDFGDTWEALDAMHRGLATYLKRNPVPQAKLETMRSAMQREGFRNIPRETLQRSVDYATKVRNMPVDYFEAKPQRAVEFDEFAGAVIPKDAPAKVREILERRGIPFREYGDVSERQAVAESFRRELHEQGGNTLFSNPIGPSLKHVAGSPATSAAVGAAAGALSDEDNRLRGAAIGAGVGLGISKVARSGGRLVPKPIGDPDIDRVLGTIATGNRASAPKDDLLTRAQKAYTAIVDELYPLRKFGREAGGSERLSHLATQAAGWRSAAYQKLRDDLKPVIESSAAVRGEVMALAKAQRALALLDQGLEKTDIPRDVLERTVEKLEARADVKAGADALQAYYRRLIDMKYQNGVIAPDQYAAIVQSGDFYTPFTREFDEAARAGTAKGGRLVNRGTGVRKMDAKSARAKTVDPFEQAILDTFEAHRTVAKQRVTNMVAEIVERDPDGTFPFLRRVANRDGARSGRVVEANVQGERRYYEVVDEDLFNAWAAFDPKTQNIAVQMLAPFKRMLQAGVTILPDFALANAIRDNVMTAVQYKANVKVQGAGVAAGAVIGAAKADEGERGKGALTGAALGLGLGSIAPNIARTLGAMRHIVKDDAIYKEFLREGGPSMNGFYPKNTDDARKLLGELERTGVKASDIISPARWWEALQYIGRVAEQSPRLAKYESVRKAGGDATEGVFGAADISLDFSKVGSHTKGIAATTAFWNAKILGWDKLARLLKSPKTWTAGVTTITAPSVALWAINKDNEEYWARPQWERNLFWLVPKDGGGFYRIPKPFEVGYIFGSLPERLLDFAYQRDPETLLHSLGDMLGSTFEGTVPLPTLPTTIFENVADFDLFRRRKIVSRSDLPNAMQADERTSSVALGVGRATGMSPQKIDHTIGNLTGGAGRIAVSLADRIARATGADARPLPPGAAKVPVLGDLGRRFQTQDGTTSDAEQSVWRRFSAAEKAYRGATELRKHGTSDEYRTYLRANARRLKEYDDLKEVTDGLREVRSVRREIARRRDLTPAQRERALRKLTDLAHSFATRKAPAGPAVARQP